MLRIAARANTIITQTNGAYGCDMFIVVPCFDLYLGTQSRLSFLLQ